MRFLPPNYHTTPPAQYMDSPLPGHSAGGDSSSNRDVVRSSSLLLPVFIVGKKGRADGGGQMGEGRRRRRDSIRSGLCIYTSRSGIRQYLAKKKIRKTHGVRLK